MIFSSDALVLYKNHPARVLHGDEKLEIELPNGSQVKVRPKDVTLLHPGACRNLKELVDVSAPPDADVLLAWEMLREDPESGHELAELAGLIYANVTPAAAWATWRLVEDGVYFYGRPEAIFARTAQAAAAEQSARLARRVEAQAWNGFLQRLRNDEFQPDADGRFLHEVEDLAFGRRSNSRALHDLGRSEQPETAHALLLECGYWNALTDPYPQRLGIITAPPEIILPPLVEETRLDLTSLDAFAIDDRENQDPDDAVSLQDCQYDAAGNFVRARLWVHVADAAALVHPDSPADLEARGRGATLYIPTGSIPMLPPAAVGLLGLGLQDVSPALSFGLEVNAAGEIADIYIRPSWVRVQRLSYDQAEENLESDANLRGLWAAARAYLARRRANGALLIDLPEVMIHLIDGQVVIRPVERLRSREMVREAMLMAGEAAARFALQHNLPFAFAIQEGLDEPRTRGIESGTSLPAQDMAGLYALRRQLKRSQVSSYPGLHAGVGLPAYSRATSPLRRYLDLVVHQQMRAFLQAQPLLDEQALLARLGAAEAAVGSVGQAEALSRRHWTLVYFLQHPGWRGEAVLVDQQAGRGKVIIPELAFETGVHVRKDLPLNSVITLAVKDVNLPDLEAHFTVVG